MGKCGIIPGGTNGKATLKVRFMGPYFKEFTPEPPRLVDKSDKKYNPVQADITAPQKITIPDFDNSNFSAVITFMINSRPVAGFSGNAPEHVAASSRCFLYDVVPVSDVAWKRYIVLVKSYGAHDFSGAIYVIFSQTERRNWDEIE